MKKKNRIKQIVQDIKTKPMRRDTFIKYYNIDTIMAYELTKYLCICKDGFVRIKSLGR